MPQATPPSPHGYPSVADESRTLREEIRLLRERQGVATDHRVARAAYTQSQVRFRTVFENSPLGQKIITPDLTIRQVSQAVVDMLGYARPEELIGRKIIEFTHPDHRADWQELGEAALFQRGA